MNRIIMLVVIALFLTGCGTLSSGVEDLTLRYGGGITEEKDYKGMLEPGTTNQFVFGSGAGDELYHYPRTQRSWVFAQGAQNNPSVDRGAVQIVTKDGVRMAVDGAIYFRLNPSEDVLRKFHEDIGLKTQAWTPEGWNRMLGTYFDQPIVRQIEAVGLQFTSGELRSEEGKRQEFARLVRDRATQEIERVVGGPYFCGPEQGGCGDLSFEVGRPELVNKKIIEAEESKREAALRADAQRERNRETLTRLDAVREEVDVLGPEAYALIRAIESGKVTFMQLPDNGQVAVPAPRGGEQ